MILCQWENLPEFMQVEEVKPYWEILHKKKGQLFAKRLFDFILAAILLFILAIPMIIIAALIKIDSSGGVFYRQERVTTYGRRFRIHKFRTMVSNADKIGSSVTVDNDVRITRLGAKLRKIRLDELPQLFDVLSGDMSFVGTRPESVHYVKYYKTKYYATLLLPAGITSEASIIFKDEDKLLNMTNDVDNTYVEKVLPVKMMWNLKSIESFSFLRDIYTMIRTLLAVIGRD